MKKELLSKKIRAYGVMAVCLAACAFVFSAVKIHVLSGNQSADMQVIMKQVPQIIADAKQDAQDVTDNYDRVYAAKAATLAYMVRKDTGFEATGEKLASIAKNMNVNNLLIIRSDGTVVASAADTAADFSLARFNQLRGAFTSSDGRSAAFEVTEGQTTRRYYGAAIDKDTEAVVEQDPAELTEQTDGVYSWKSVLSGLKCGYRGFSFAVSAQDGTFLWYPKEELTGTDALLSGIRSEDLEDGRTGWMTIDGERCYCGVCRIDALKAYVICAVPFSAMFSRTVFTVVTLVAACFVIFFLVTFYSVERADELLESGTDPENHEKGMSREDMILAAERNMRGRMLGIGLAGVAAAFLIGFYLQSLSSLSAASISERNQTAVLEDTLKTNSASRETLKAEYDRRYLNKAKAAADILSRNSALRTHDELADLARVLDVEYIILFDRNGRELTASNAYVNFVISDTPGDQSYDFRKILGGVEYVIQDAQNDEGSGQFRQYIGYMLTDADGMADGLLQIAVYPERLEKMLSATSMSTVLGKTRSAANGFAFAVSKADGTFSYYPDDTLTGLKASDYGITEQECKGGFSDFITLNGSRYFADCLEESDNYIFLADPMTHLYGDRLRYGMTAAVCTAASLFVICLVIIALYTGDLHREVRELREEETQTAGGGKAAGTAAGTTEAQQMISVKLPNGTVARTRSASARWAGGREVWEEMTAEQKTGRVFYILMAVFSALICLSLLFRNIFFGSNSIFSYVLSGNWVRSWNVFSLTSVLLTVCVVGTIVMAISTLLSVTEKSLGPKGETISRLTRNFLKYFVIIGLIYYSLAAFGVDVNALVTSAGILTLVIGLGARDLISDILAGLFIVFEGEFQVGDIVTVGDWRGTVQEIGVRTTKIMDAGGNVKIFSNSAVSGVINMTRRHSFCVVDVGIEYGESLERVEAVLARELPLMAKKYDAIREGPFYKGVVSLSDSAVILRIIAKCDEGDRVQLTRDLTRAVKLVFDANDINIPFPQVVVNQPPEFRKATVKEKKAAERYISKEKEASTDFATIDNDGNS